MMSKELFLSTDMFDVKDRDDFWRDAVKPIYDISSADDERKGGFSGTLQSHPVGEILIGSTEFNAQRYERTRKIIAQGGLDQYVIQVMIKGSLQGDFADLGVQADVGDIVVLDLAKTIKSSVSAGARITTVVSREKLERLSGGRSLHGLVLKAGAPATALLVDFLRSLNEVSPRLDATQAVAAHDSAMLLLRSAVTGGYTTDQPAGHINMTMRKRILEFIEENLTNPLLGPAMIVHHFKVSRSHLYRAFENDGGVAKIIRERRLDLAYREILNASGQPATIKEIVYRCGFLDVTGFGKAFQSRFGSLPKSVLKSDRASFILSENEVHMLHHHLSDQAKKLGII